MFTPYFTIRLPLSGTEQKVEVFRTSILSSLLAPSRLTNNHRDFILQPTHPLALSH